MGVRVALIASVSTDYREVTMKFAFASRDMPKDAKEEDLETAKASEVGVRIEQLTVPSGDTAVVWTEPTLDSTRPRFVVLVRPRAVRPEDLGPTEPPVTGRFSAPASPK